MLNNLLSIVPQVNLVSNIGFDDRGSHCVNKRWPFANVKREEMLFPLVHPEFVLVDRRADLLIHFSRFGIPQYKHYYYKIMRRIDKLVDAIRSL